MSKVTIRKADGRVGTLTKAADGKWDMAIDGKAAQKSCYYTDDQVERIIAKARAAGSVVEVE